MYTKQQIENTIKKLGYAWFESNKDYDVNIVGIRNSATGARITNLFDDWLTLSYKVNNVWQYHIWPCTTDPGTTYSQRLLTPRGVARLIPGQYRGSHAIGMHQGKYIALRQVKPLKVWRDNNKDLKFDPTLIDEGLFGINIHRSSATGTSKQVDGWSAGCQVFANINDFNKFMNIMHKARDVFGNTFTYTLIESKDI